MAAGMPPARSTSENDPAEIAELGAQIGHCFNPAHSAWDTASQEPDRSTRLSRSGQPRATRSGLHEWPSGVAEAAPGELALGWRGCGPGCFVAPVSWGSGQNPVALNVAADGWPGGTVSLAVPWPARSGAEQLQTAVAAMARVPTFTLYERVTSDSSTGPGLVRPLVMSGKDFLGVEPYGSGAATQTALLRDDGGQVTLAVGFPGDLTQAELVVDGQGRLLRESLTAPNHWVTRSFVYPEP